MIRKFVGDVRAGWYQFQHTRFPAWTTSWYWLDRYQDHKDRTGPRRHVSRSKVVRYALGMAYAFGPVGWLWAIVATAALMWFTWGIGGPSAVALLVGFWAALRTGRAWAIRNVVQRIDWEDDCPRCDLREDEDQ